jgi:hypothetical protein
MLTHSFFHNGRASVKQGPQKAYRQRLARCLLSAFTLTALWVPTVAAQTVAETTKLSQVQARYDVGPYASVLKEHVNAQGQVDYAGLKRSAGDLIRYTQTLALMNPSSYQKWSNSEKIAFWLNAYNALTLKSIIEKYPVSSIKKIAGVWNRKTHQIMGKPMTLDDIEHQILRKQFNEPRIHMALVCASKGCPPLLNQPYTGSALNAQLNGRAQAFVSEPQNFRIDRSKNEVYISSLFKWYGQDFEKQYGTQDFQGSAKERASLHFLSQYLGGEANYLKTAKYQVRYLDYDWSLNQQ